MSSPPTPHPPHRPSSRNSLLRLEVARPTLDRLATRVGSPARWSDVDKCLMVQGLMFPNALLVILSMTLVDGWPFWVGLDPALHHDLLIGMVCVCAVWPVAILVTLRLRNRGRVPRPTLVRLTVYFYALNIAWFGYITGPFLAAGAFAILGGLVIGLMLFQRRVVVAGMCVYFVGMWGIAELCERGVLPYRAVFMHAVGPRGDDTDYLIRMSAGSVILGLLVLLIMGLIIESWRYREEKLAKASRTDALTGVLNRGSIMRLAGRTMRAFQKSSFALVMVDVDHFKRVNDEHGHLVGDEVLRRVAAGLEGVLRKDDAVGRYGGEEFLIVLPGSTQDEARLVAERCRAMLHALRFEVAPDLRVSASFGVAARPPLIGDTLDGLLADADAAMYRAKRSGRDRVVVATEPDVASGSDAAPVGDGSAPDAQLAPV